MKRRHFIKNSCTACVGSMIGISALSLLESCASGKIVKQDPNSADKNIIVVDKTAFAENEKYIIVRPINLKYDILLYKNSETQYTALYLQCTHYDNPVFANKKELFCPTHGSKFNFDGQVIQDPANTPLKKFNTSITEKQIKINL